MLEVYKESTVEPCEVRFKERAQRAGYTVVRHGRDGWPDFILVKEGEEPLFVEVKRWPRFSEKQRKVLAALEKLGFAVRISVCGNLNSLVSVEAVDSISSWAYSPDLLERLVPFDEWDHLARVRGTVQ